jgi:formylmethanofuran dehydrogenase subunit E
MSDTPKLPTVPILFHLVSLWVCPKCYEENTEDSVKKIGDHVLCNYCNYEFTVSEIREPL